MRRAWIKISVIVVIIVFMGVMVISPYSINGNSHSSDSSNGIPFISQSSTNSDPSVHLYVNGNGYVEFSAHYTVDGFISCSFDNDKTMDFNTNDVPTGTVFHLASSPDPGYTFEYWTGSVNSTSNLINITVNNNINEEAIYEKITLFSVTFSETGLPSGSTWWVNLNGQNITSSSSTITFDVSDGTYSYTVQSMGTYGVNYNPISSTGTVTVDGFNQTEYIYYYPEYYLHVTASPSSYGSITTSSGWYSSGEYLALLANPNSGYAFSSWKGTGSGSYSGTSNTAYITMNGPINETAIFDIPRYSVTFSETGLPSGSTWWVNLTNGMKSGPITASSYIFYLANGRYTYMPSYTHDYYVANGTFKVDGSNVNVPVNYLKYSYLEISVSPSISLVSINGSNITLKSGSFSEYTMQGYYYITINSPGYKSYSNMVYLSWNGTYNYRVSLTPIKTYGYLTGTVLPGNATVTANGIGIPVMDGYFNVSLAPGTYYITVTAPGYSGNISVEKITNGRTTPLTVKLTKSVKTVTVSGYLSQANASLTVNGMSAYVNSTGYYDISVPSGNVVISAYEAGYYPYSKVVDLTSSTVINITLIKEPKATSTVTVNNTVTSGYNVIVTNLTTNNGYISMNYNATVNGTITVLLPFNEIRNATISDILNSKVYIDGTLYSDFSITVTSNGSAVLTVYGLAGDPALYWKYSPDASLPSYYNITFKETGLPSGTSWSVTLNGVRESSTTSIIVFSEPNGTYSYTVNNPSGYLLSSSSGTITVSGNNITNEITFKSNKTTSILSNTELYEIIGAVAVIAAIGGAVILIRRRK
jgi:hypothetical protein